MTTYCRRVVDQGIDANKLLEKHETHSDMSASPASSPEAIDPGNNFEPNTVHFVATAKKGWMPFGRNLIVKGDLGANVIPFQHDPRVRGGQLTELGQVLQRLLVTMFGSKPSGREGHEENANSEDEAGDDLEEEGQAP